MPREDVHALDEQIAGVVKVASEPNPFDKLDEAETLDVIKRVLDATENLGFDIRSEYEENEDDDDDFDDGDEDFDDDDDDFDDDELDEDDGQHGGDEYDDDDRGPT